MAQGATNHPDRRLDSWKEIAAFFGRDERTVRRWEKESALPVHRVPGGAKGRVFAYEGELDQWLSTPQALRSTTSELEPEVGPLQIDPLQTSPLQFSQVEPEGKRWHPGTAWMLVGTLAICAVLAAGIWVYRKSHRFAAYASAPNASRVGSKDLVSTAGISAPRLGPDSVAVLPFTNVRGTASTDYLSDGITESLIGNLAHLPQLKVRSRDSVFRYKGKDVDVQTAGSNLGVSVLVSGRVMVQGDAIEVSAELTDVRDNTEIWGHRYTGKRADLISMQQQMAGDIAGKLRSSLSATDKEQVINQGTQDSEAYSLYLKGRYAWNNRTYHELEKAISYFNQAVAKDPGYALAYAGLADAYGVMPDYGGTPSENFPKSNAAARKALELDPTLARPHAVLGVTEMEYDWDFAGGEAEFKKAFELDPDDATAHQWYSEQLAKNGGKEQEALAEINRAHELDPLSPIINREIAYAHILAGQFDEAIAVCTKLANDNPTFAAAHSCLAGAYWAKGMYPQTIAEWKTYGQISGDQGESDFASALEQGFKLGGWKNALRKGIEARKAQRKTGYYSAYLIADLYAEMGDKDEAFRWLNTARLERESGLKGLRTDHSLDPLRLDPRYAELERKVGLPR